MRKLAVLLLGLIVTLNAAAVTLPYTFNSTVPPSQANANFSALRDAINAHEALSNGHNTSLEDVLAVDDSVGSESIDFNHKELFNARVENVSADPTCSALYLGRLIYNTTDELFKICDGSSFVSIAGSGVNTLSSVLNAGNSAGAFDINLNNNELLSARVENLASDPSAGNTGRIFFHTGESTLKVDTGASIQAVGGAQGLSSVLGVSNSAGATNIDFNGNQALNLYLQKLASDPGSSSAGRVYYNTTDNVVKFHNGTSFLEIGNTNTLAEVLALGNSAGSTKLNMNQQEIENFKVDNLAAPPGSGIPGLFWFDTGTDQLQFGTSGANQTVATLDQTQTLTNKTIDGDDNTIQDVPDSALSSNISKLDTAQTVSGKKTFSTHPVISKIETPSGAQHTITDGLSNDTFVLANAVQTLAGKTLNAPSLSGNLDFNLFQAVELRLENRASDPAPATAGRMWYKTSTGEIVYDTGTEIRALTSNAQIPAWSFGGNAGLDDTINYIGTSDAVDLVLKSNDTEILRLTSAGEIDTNLGAGVPFTDASGIVGLIPGITSMEVQALDNISSNIQTQLDSKVGLNALSANAPLSYDGSGNFSIPQGSAVQDGFIDSADFSRFDVAATSIDNATPNAIADTIMKRDGSGNVAANQFTGDLVGDVTGNLTGNVVGNVTGDVTGDLTGNASTASALAANPADCAPGEFAVGINADGTPVCDTPVASGSGVTAGDKNQIFVADPDSDWQIKAGVVSMEALADSVFDDLTEVSVTSLDFVAIADSSDSGNKKKASVQSIIDAVNAGLSPIKQFWFRFGGASEPSSCGTSTTCTIYDQWDSDGNTSGIIVSVTTGATAGRATVDVATGVCSAPPMCNVSVYGDANVQWRQDLGITSAESFLLQAAASSTGSATSAGATVHCSCPR